MNQRYFEEALRKAGIYFGAITSIGLITTGIICKIKNSYAPVERRENAKIAKVEHYSERVGGEYYCDRIEGTRIYFSDSELVDFRRNVDIKEGNIVDISLRREINPFGHVIRGLEIAAANSNEENLSSWNR